MFWWLSLQKLFSLLLKSFSQVILADIDSCLVKFQIESGVKIVGKRAMVVGNSLQGELR